MRTITVLVAKASHNRAKNLRYLLRSPCLLLSRGEYAPYQGGLCVSALIGRKLVGDGKERVWRLPTPGYRICKNS